MYLPFELMQFSITLLAVSLLVSALKDIFLDMGRIALLDRDIESIADRINENLVLDLGIYNPGIEIGHHFFMGSKATWEVMPEGVTTFEEGP
jgi:hypothetical protein